MTTSSTWTTIRNDGWTYRDIVDAASAGQTCLQFYAGRYSHSSSDQWRDRLRQGRIRRLEEVLSADSTLAVGDKLSYHRAGWIEPSAPRQFGLLYRRNDLLAVAKPPGLQVLPAAGFLRNTLLDVVRQHCGTSWSPAHRLGRGTSGLVLFVRPPSGEPVARAFREGGVRKVYRALVQGHGLPAAFDVTTPIGELDDPVMGRLHGACDDGKASLSHVRRLECRADGTTLVDVEIPTGRPHQIRIHMAAAGWPLVGEPLYGQGGRPERIDPQARPGDIGYRLHAGWLELADPTYGDPVRLYCRPPSSLRLSDEP